MSRSTHIILTSRFNPPFSSLDFTVSDGFVINTITRNGVEEKHAYLVEPLRSSSVVTKFSGTLGTNNHTDKLSATISAFAHFVMNHTASTFTLADIQGLFYRFHDIHLYLICPLSQDRCMENLAASLS